MVRIFQAAIFLIVFLPAVAVAQVTSTNKVKSLTTGGAVQYQCQSSAAADAAIDNGYWTIWCDAVSNEIEFKAKDSAGDVITATVGSGAAHGDGANCLAGEIPLGVNAAGAVQGCYEPAATDIASGTMADARIDGSLEEDEINHDNLVGFVANEHIDWTSTTSDLNTTGEVRSGKLFVDVQATGDTGLHIEEVAAQTGDNISVFTNGGIEVFTVAAGGECTVGKSAGADFNLFRFDSTITDGELLGAITGQGIEAATVRDSAKIQMFADGAWGTNDWGSYITFSPVADGAASAVEKMRINSTGIGIGEIDPQVLFHLDGAARFEDFLSCTALETDANGDLVCGADDGTPVILDLADDASNESLSISEVATTGDTNNIFTEPTADKLLIDVGQNWPTADAANALSANGANCSAGNYPLGVDASGAVEGCTADDDSPDSDAEVPDAITVDSGSIQNSTIVLQNGSGGAPTTDGEIKYDRTTERLQVGDGATTQEFYPGAHNSYTATGTLLNLSGSAFSINEGTLTDGKWCKYESAGTQITCNVDPVVDTDTNTNAATVCAGTTTYLDGEGGCDDISSVYAAISHNHAATEITSGTIAHERGGLEADVSLYNGLVRIASGATSNVTDLAGLNTAIGASIADGAHTTDTVLTEEEVEDYVGTMLGGTETRISVTYNDVTNSIDFVVDDMNDDVPESGDFGNAADLEATGELSADVVDQSKIADNAIQEEHLKAVDAPADEECLTYEATVGDFEWQACGGGGSSEWTDTGTTLHPSETGDEVVIGATTPVLSAKLSIDGDADQRQLVVQGNATQTNELVLVEKSDGTDLLTLDNSGNLVIPNRATASTLYADIQSTTDEGLHVEGIASQTSNYIYIADSSGIPVWLLDASKDQFFANESGGLTQILRWDSSITDGENLGKYTFGGLSTGLAPQQSSYLQCVAKGTWGASADFGSHCYLATVPDGSGTAANVIHFDSDQTIDLPAYDCSGNANGGALTVDASGNVTCSDDDGGTSAMDAILLKPENANIPSSNPGIVDLGSNQHRILYDASTDESNTWTNIKANNYASGTLTAKIGYSMASATSGAVIFCVQVWCVSDGDAADVDTESYDTANCSSATTVPATAGYLDEISITLTNKDSIADGDLCAFKLYRDADAGGDTATGDAEVRYAQVSE